MSATVMCIMAIGMSLTALTALLMKVPAFVAALQTAWNAVSGFVSMVVGWAKGLFAPKS